MKKSMWVRLGIALACVAALAGCTGEQAFAAGFATGRAVAITLIALVLIVAFGLLSYKFGPALRQKRKLGTWLAGGGHLLAIACGVLIAFAENLPPLRATLGVAGTLLLLVGHVGLWMVVLGLKPGKSRLTHDVGVIREESPAMHYLSQALAILFGLMVLLGGTVYLLLQGFNVK